MRLIEKNPRQRAGCELVVNGTFALRRMVRGPWNALVRPTAGGGATDRVRTTDAAASEPEPEAPDEERVVAAPGD